MCRLGMKKLRLFPGGMETPPDSMTVLIRLPAQIPSPSLRLATLTRVPPGPTVSSPRAQSVRLVLIPFPVANYTKSTSINKIILISVSSPLQTFPTPNPLEVTTIQLFP